MATELEIIWNEFKKHCAETATKKDEEDGMLVYMDTCRPASLDNGLLTLDVPTVFSK